MKIIYVNRYIYKLALPLIIIVAALLSGLYILAEGSTSNQETFVRILHGFIMTAGLWIGCILIVTWLWKKYPWQEAPLKHLLLEIVLIFVYTIVFSSAIYFLERKFFDYSMEIRLVYDAFTTILITYFITAIHEAVFFYRQWRLHFSKSIKLQRDNIEANYEALKNQVNPHFLFNSLNSLTSMVDDNPDAVDYITNLSEFLRYLLRSNEKELVNLKDETEITGRYMQLQKSRFGDALNVTVNISKEKLKYLLPPLALQMLVENCIKHNIISLQDPLEIRIYTENQSLVVENNLQLKKEPRSTGQGLKNIKNRYSLFTTREVEILNDEEFFRVKLPLLILEK